MKISTKISLKTINRDMGLPSGQVHDLTADSEGVFWFVGPEGLSRYDGSRIKTFGQNQGLQTHGLRSIAANKNGMLFIGSDRGLDVMNRAGEIRPLIDVEEWRYGFVECLAIGTDDELWIGTSDGLLRWTETVGIEESADLRMNSGLILDLLVANDGVVWATGKSFGILSLRNGSWQHPENNDWKQIGNTLCLANSPNGDVFVGGEKGIVQISADGSRIEIPIVDYGETVTAIVADEEELWLGIGGKLSRFEKIETQWQFDQNVLENDSVNVVYRDNAGNLWAGSDNGGVHKIGVLRKSIRQTTLPDVKAVYTLRPAGNTMLLGGTKSSWRISTDSGIAAQRIESLDGMKVWDIISDRSGTIWAATELGLFNVTVSGRVERIGDDDPTLASPGRVLLEGVDGIWVGTLKGLVCVTDTDIRTELDNKGLPLGYVYTLAENLDGNLLIGTLGNGLWIHTPTGTNRLLSPELKLMGNTYDIEVGEDGRIAILQDNRIIVLDSDGECELAVTTQSSVSGWSALWKDGNLLVGSSAGLVEYKIPGGSETRRITAQSSLADWEFTTSRSLATDKSGNLFCGTSGGLKIVSLEELDNFGELPEIKLSKAEWTNAEVKDTDGKFTVNPGKWTLDVEAYFANFLNEDETRISFRLKGFDENWIDTGKLAKIQYNSLPSGNYTLETQVYNPLFGKSLPKTLFDIEVTPPWWSKGLLAVPLAATEAIVELFESRRRNSRLHERNIELEQHVAERTLALEKTMDALQSANRELRLLSSTDALTGVPNRGSFEETFRNELERARRGNTFISIILVDVDYFKLYNDTYGHPKGDECLRKVSRAITESLRVGDLLARIGGEEFAIIVPNSDVTGTLRIAERTRQLVERLRIPNLKSNAGNVVTISAGVAVYKFESSELPEDLNRIRESIVCNADKALYHAKDSGRNQVALSNENETLICFSEHERLELTEIVQTAVH